MKWEGEKAEAIKQETTMLRCRLDTLTNECGALKQKLAQAIERTSGFVPTSELEAGKDEDAAEVAALEAELADVENAIDVANHDNKTYLLMIERIRKEAYGWTPTATLPWRTRSGCPVAIAAPFLADLDAKPEEFHL